MIHRPQVVRILALVLRHVRLVDPGEGVHKHVIHGRGEVAHERQEKEGNLEDMLFDVVDCFDEVFVPGEVGEEVEELEEEADAECLSLIVNVGMKIS